MPKYPYRTIGTPLNLDNWERLNRNFEDIETDFKEQKTDYNGKIGQANGRIDNIIGEITEELSNQIVDAARLIWRSPVDTFADLTITYPTPEEGWAVYVRNHGESGEVYRYDGEAWIKIQDFDPTVINELDSRLTSQLAENATNALLFGTPTDTLTTKVALALAASDNVFVPSGSYTGDFVVNNLDKKKLDFRNVSINGNVRLSRIKNSQITGYLKATGDIDVIGSVNNTFEKLEGSMVYLQNWVNWGGFYWTTFEEIICKAFQVRQAKLNPSSSVSAINQNVIRKLIAQYGLSENNWYNVWFRSGASGGTLEHTTLGTDPIYTGSDKWNELFTNPFLIENFDFSYTDAPGGTDSYGIVHEGGRPLYLNAGFIENITYSTKGKLIVQKLETRNTTTQALDGNFEYVPAEIIGKLGSFRPVSIGLIDNCEFAQGLKDFTSFGSVSLVTASSVSAPTSSSGLVVKIDQSPSVASRLIHTFVASYTGVVSIVVRGKNLGLVNVQNGSLGTEFVLGYAPDPNNFGYSVARANITRGQTVTVSIYTPAYTTLGTGQTTLVTGVQVFQGYAGSDFRQTNLSEKSLLLPTSTALNQWVDGFHIMAPANAKVKLSFEVLGKVEGRGFYRGYYEGIVSLDASRGFDAAGSSTTVKTYVYREGEPTTGIASIDTQFVSRAGGGVTLQFAKQSTGTILSADFVNIRVTYPGTITSLTPSM
ncbi:hypothetical protein EauS123_00051 [Exiguobacterium phage vB_EauS-123]|nr:hypothetical protein EauS123_00051 [Exiguobacterium phage vB_EauS-123]